MYLINDVNIEGLEELDENEKLEVSGGCGNTISGSMDNPADSAGDYMHP